MNERLERIRLILGKRLVEALSDQPTADPKAIEIVQLALEHIERIRSNRDDYPYADTTIAELIGAMEKRLGVPNA